MTDVAVYTERPERLRAVWNEPLSCFRLPDDQAATLTGIHSLIDSGPALTRLPCRANLSTLLEVSEKRGVRMELRRTNREDPCRYHGG